VGGRVLLRERESVLLRGGGLPGGSARGRFAGIRPRQRVFGPGDYPLTYKWGSVSYAGAVGGSYLQEGLVNASESFSFTGTSLGLVMWSGPDRGKAKVVITTKGEANNTRGIDTYAATAGDKTFSWTGLSNAKHTVKIVVRGTQNAQSTGPLIGFDAVTVNGTQFNPKLTARWSDGAGTNVWLSGQTGANLTFYYRGTGVGWFVYHRTDCGRARVTIDGINIGTFDLYGTGAEIVSLTYPGITDTGHTLKISVLGTKRAASTGTLVTVAGLAIFV
jgi:hypothetical protein